MKETGPATSQQLMVIICAFLTMDILGFSGNVPAGGGFFK
jgi:hypothetical protein